MPKPQTTYLVGIIQYLGHTEKRPEGIRFPATNSSRIFFPLDGLTAAECGQLVVLMKKRYPLGQFPVDDLERGYAATFRVVPDTELDDTAKRTAELARINSADESEGPWAYQVRKYVDRIIAARPARPKMDTSEGILASDESAADVPPRARRAGEQYRKAVIALDCELTDGRAYSHLAKTFQLAEDRGIKSDDDRLPTFETWQRNLRIYRQATGQHKNTPRAGRGGRNIHRSG